MDALRRVVPIAENTWILTSTLLWPVLDYQIFGSNLWWDLSTMFWSKTSYPGIMRRVHSPSFVTSPTSQLILILQALRHFTYVTAHSPTLPSLYLRPNSFSNTSVASPTSQLILQPFFRLSYVTGFSLMPPCEPPMLCISFLFVIIVPR